MRKLFFWSVILLFAISLILAVYVFLNYGSLIKKEVKTGKEEIFVCAGNDDCVPEDPLLGLNYVCREGKCETEILANPASVNCQEKGGKVELIQRIDGSIYGVCLFPDKTECEEWKFLKEECNQGEFNPHDNIWEGSVKLSQGGRDIVYLEMLNGENPEIASNDENIQSILNSLASMPNKVKVIGIKRVNSEAFNHQEILVTEIADLGDISFNEASLEESLKFAISEIEKDGDFIKNKGKNLKLLEAVKIDCPYCWNFIFTYLSGKKTIFLDVIAQEGVIRDLAETGPMQYKSCDEFSLAELCTEQYEPVCAGIENISDAEGVLIRWDNFSNPCKACIYKEENIKINWYKHGECQ